MRRPEPTKVFMKLLGALNYCSKYFPNLHVILAPSYNLPHDDIHSHWKDELQSLFSIVKRTLMHTCDLTLPNKKSPF